MKDCWIKDGWNRVFLIRVLMIPLSYFLFYINYISVVFPIVALVSFILCMVGSFFYCRESNLFWKPMKLKWVALHVVIWGLILIAIIVAYIFFASAFVFTDKLYWWIYILYVLTSLFDELEAYVRQFPYR